MHIFDCQANIPFLILHANACTCVERGIIHVRVHAAPLRVGRRVRFYCAHHEIRDSVVEAVPCSVPTPTLGCGVRVSMDFFFANFGLCFP